MVAIVSHRTNAGDAPENTLAGIAAAIRDRCRAIEVDVRRTRDGALVLMHDETLERTTGDLRRVDEVTLDEIQRLRTADPTGNYLAEPVPTLAQAMTAIRGHSVIELDYVDERLTEDLLELVAAQQAETWTWWTPHPPEVAKTLKERCPESRVYLGISLEDEIFPDIYEAITAAADLGLAGINPSHRILDQPIVEEAHRRGLEVGCWTLNESAAAERVLRLGVDLVTTDYPRMVQAIATRMGVPVAR